MADPEKSTQDLIERARGEGLELCLWQGRLAWRRATKASAKIRSEIMQRTKEVRTALTELFVQERSRPGAPHKWVIRLGDDPKADKCRPALLACGPQEWYMRMIRQAQEFATSDEERRRWIILEQDQVGAVLWDERGVLVASVVKLPDGVELGGPRNSQAEILSACQGCLAPPIDDERIKEILKNDD